MCDMFCDQIQLFHPLLRPDTAPIISLELVCSDVIKAFKLNLTGPRAFTAGFGASLLQTL